MTTTHLTPVTRFSVSGELPQQSEDISLVDVTLRRITDEELLQHLHISNRVFGPRPDEFGYEKHGIVKHSSTSILNELQEVELCRSTHAFVSQLPFEEHQSKVNDILHCWRLLKMSRVACPITYRSSGPGVNFQRPIEGRLGGVLEFDSTLLNQATTLLPNIGRIPQEDLDLIDLANETGTKTLSVFLLVVIAERSLMKGDKNEISFKISVYGSRLLEFLGVADATSAYSILRKAYKIRSAFAHDGKIDQADISRILPSLYEYVAIIRKHTALQPSTATPKGKKALLFRPTNHSSRPLNSGC